MLAVAWDVAASWSPLLVSYVQLWPELHHWEPWREAEAQDPRQGACYCGQDSGGSRGGPGLWPVLLEGPAARGRGHGRHTRVRGRL